MFIINKNKIIFLVLIISFISITVIFANDHEEKVYEHRIQYWIEELDVDNVHKYITGKGVKIAIIDAGIGYTHYDLTHHKNQEVAFYQENNSNTDHGTMIAGIISAKPQSENGVVGIAPDATIISFDIIDDNYNSDVNNLIEAIKLAIEEDVDIINMSIGFNEYSPELHAVIKQAYDKEITLVSSVGNEDNKVLYPAKFNEVISVAATDRDGNPLYNYDVSDDFIIYTYGIDILSTYLKSKEDKPIYISATGSSYSTAIVTGLIALIKENNPSITNYEIEHILRQETKILSTSNLLSKSE